MSQNELTVVKGGAVDEGEKEFFADPRKNTRIDVPAIRGWIEVRDEVGIGEERRVFANAVKGSTQTKDGELRTDYDMEKVSFGNVVLYVVDWSLKTTLSADSLKNLKPAIYKAIDDAVQQHINRVTEGNALSLPKSSDSPTSASVA